MAARQVQDDKASNELDLDDCVCSVCMDTYSCPKVLPCFHTFCKECLSKIVKEQCITLKYVKANVVSSPPIVASPTRIPATTSLIETAALDSIPATSQVSGGGDDGNWIVDSEPVISDENGTGTGITCTCPVCQEKHILSHGGVEDLPDDAHILEKLEQTSIKQTGSMKTFKCVLCYSDDEVMEYCSKCPGFLCEICVPAHKRQSRYSDHQTVSNDELSPELYISSLRSKVITCRDHTKEIVFRCNDCCSFLCPKCISGKHRSHNFDTIEDSDEALKNRARKVIDSSAQVLTTFRHQRDYILRIEKEVVNSTHSDKLKTEINRHFDECIKYLQSKRQELLDKVDEDSVLLKKQVWSQKESLEQTITAIESGIQFAEKACLVHNPIERINMNSQVISRLEQVLDKTQTLLSINPPLVLKCTNSPESCLSIPDLSPLLDEDISLDTDSDVIEQPQICVTALLRVKFAVLLSEPQLQILYGKSQQILDESLVVTYESEDQDNCYNLQFVPRVSGEHFVEVRLAGVVVAKKNFKVSGEPRYGNKVQCGPDWHNQPMISMYGTVTTLRSGRVPSVTVTWEDDNKTQCEYKWGKDGEYEIEISPN